MASTGNNTRGNPNLVPFDSERARAAGKRSAAARAARREAERAANETRAAEATKTLEQWAATFQRSDLGDRCALAAQKIADDVLRGAIEVTGRDAAPLLTALVDVARLEAGQHTSAHMQVTMSGDQAMSRIEALRTQAAAQLAPVPRTPQPDFVELNEVGGDGNEQPDPDVQMVTPPPPEGHTQ